jgi:hypothetical protein
LLIFSLLLARRGKRKLPHGANLQHEGDNMQQAEHTNIIKMPSRIELLWERHEAAAKERSRIYAWELAGADGAHGDAACARVEAVVDAAYNAVEDIVDEIIAAKETSVADFAIKARVLAWHGCVEDVGYYRPEAILQFFADLQTFAAR